MVLPYKCMVGQCTHTLSLPEVFFEARGKVMEMVEHYPSQGKPAKLPTSAVNVRFHASAHDWRMAQYGGNGQSAEVG